MRVASLTGEGYEYMTSGVHRHATAFHLNNRGVTGLSGRFAADGTPLGFDAWFAASGSNGVAINPSGGVYDKATPAGTFRYAQLSAFNTAGHVLGLSSRFAPDGNFLGRDAWLYTGNGPAAILGLSGADYQFVSSGSVSRTGEPLALSDGGHAIGTSQRFDAAGTGLGQDAWLSDSAGSTMLIGLVGPGYECIESAGVRRSSSPAAVNVLGHAIGVSRRYGASGSETGLDGWLYDGNSKTTAVGLSGAPYEWTNTSGETVRVNRPSMLNEAGEVAGTTEIPPSGGADAWVQRDPTEAARAISLSGLEYEYTNSLGVCRNASVVALTSGGTVVGFNERYATNGLDRGRDIWLHARGGTTTVINLVGPGYEQTLAPVNLRRSAIIAVSDSGWVLGSTERNGTGLGFDVWAANGSSPTRRVNLIGSEYEYNDGSTLSREGWGFAISATGAAVGYSQRFGSGGRRVGFDVWYADESGASRRINLVGPNYEYVESSGGVARSGRVLAMNEREQVLGTSFRFDSFGNSLGQSGWFHDPITGITTALEFSLRPDGRCDTFPTLLTDEGVVLGTYSVFETGAPTVNRVFWWSQEAGKHDLGDLVVGGLSAAGWSRLLNVFNPAVPGAIGQTAEGAPFYIAGNGLTGDQVSGETVYMLSAVVPEPAHALAGTLLLMQILSRGRRNRLRACRVA